MIAFLNLCILSLIYIYIYCFCLQTFILGFFRIVCLSHLISKTADDLLCSHHRHTFFAIYTCLVSANKSSSLFCDRSERGMNEYVEMVLECVCPRTG